MCTSGTGTLERVERKGLRFGETWIVSTRTHPWGGRGFVSLLSSTCASELLGSFLSAWTASHALNRHFVLISLATVIVLFPEASSVTVAGWVCNDKVILPVGLDLGLWLASPRLWHEWGCSNGTLTCKAWRPRPASQSPLPHDVWCRAGLGFGTQTSCLSFSCAWLERPRWNMVLGQAAVNCLQRKDFRRVFITPEKQAQAGLASEDDTSRWPADLQCAPSLGCCLEGNWELPCLSFVRVFCTLSWTYPGRGGWFLNCVLG